MRAELIVNNVPEYAKGHPIWVVRIDEQTNDKAWFYGAWDDEEKAREIARDVGGLIVYNKAISNNATNGDMIMATFPNTEFRLSSGFYHDNFKDCSFVYRWWNAPYKG